VAGVLYQKCVPGLCATGSDRNTRVSLSSPSKWNAETSSACWPVFIRSRSRSRIALRLSLTVAGASSGKAATTLSSSVSLPSAIASPTAVEVKLLLSEYMTCGSFFPYGVHQPSATTRPCRTTITLWTASILASAASTKAWTAFDGMPCASGSLRGQGLPLRSYQVRG